MTTPPRNSALSSPRPPLASSRPTSLLPSMSSFARTSVGSLSSSSWPPDLSPALRRFFFFFSSHLIWLPDLRPLLPPISFLFPPSFVIVLFYFWLKNRKNFCFKKWMENVKLDGNVVRGGHLGNFQIIKGVIKKIETPGDLL